MVLPNERNQSEADDPSVRDPRPSKQPSQGNKDRSHIRKNKPHSHSRVLLAQLALSSC